MKTDRELIELLRAYGRTGHPGKMGCECVVEKSLLNEVADRLPYHIRWFVTMMKG